MRIFCFVVLFSNVVKKNLQIIKRGFDDLLAFCGCQFIFYSKA